MIYLAIPFVIAAAVIAAAWLDRHGTPGPALCLALPVRLVMPHTGHHRDRYATETPARYERPEQVSRPGDPRMGVREVPAGATPLSPGVPSPAPEAAAHVSAPVDDAAAVLPAPPQAPAQGAGQHAFAPVVVAFPDGHAAILDEHGAWHVRELAFDGRSARETGAQPALVRGGRVAFEAWQDAAVNQ